MENDTIRGSSGNTLVDLWIDGKMRAIAISRGAIEAHLGLAGDRAAAMSDDERCEFVRANLALVTKAARERLRETSPTASSIGIDAGQLGVTGAGRGGDRRKTERRKAGERRKADRPEAIPPEGDRRKTVRRKSDRRGKPKGPAKS
ncbi:MAG TPA: hypothetical protein VFP57_03870 [Sphingomicrobium sp.]|jgi:hypothetical protein|nr:hypothetical protein [Sphingomicrobium sp.]